MAEAGRSIWHLVDDLARAKALIDQLDFVSAAAIYQTLLATELPDDLRNQTQTNLIVALCAMAQNDLTPAEIALGYVDQAEKVQLAALKSHDQHENPGDWISGRANLALIHLARYRITRDDRDVLLAHMVLDGTENALRQSRDVELLDWVRSIRDYLADLRERRASRR